MLGDTEEKQSTSRTGKPLKTCPYCNKVIADMGLHIARQHPNIFSKIDELDASKPSNTPTGVSSYAPINAKVVPPVGDYYPDVDTLVKAKLNTLLNIEIIKALTNSQDGKLTKLAEIMQPKQEIRLDEIKAFHDLFYKEPQPQISGGASWLDVANQAIPILSEMMKNKGGDVNGIRQGNSRIERLPQSVPSEITGDTRKSVELIEKSNNDIQQPAGNIKIPEAVERNPAN